MVGTATISYHIIMPIYSTVLTSSKTFINQFVKKGDYKKWLETTQGLRNKSTALKIIMATTLASPLLEKLDLQPYMVNVVWRKWFR